MKECTVAHLENSRNFRALLVRVVQIVVLRFDLEISEKVFNKYKLKELYFTFYNIF